MKRSKRAAAVLILAGWLGPAAGLAQTAPVQLDDVRVDRSGGELSVRLHTTATPKYSVSLFDSPTRLVIDLPDTRFAWGKAQRATLAAPEAAPIREVRGSQFKPHVARVVVELTRKVGYRVEEGPDGLVIRLDAPAAAAPAQARVPASRPEPPAVALRPAASPEPAPRPAPEPASRPDPPVAAAEPPASATPETKLAAAPVPLMQASPAAAAPAPLRLAQAAPAAPAPANGSRLISLDFKDAEVINLLRILSSESGRNITAGPDVKGKISITLRNVTWEQALDTILETGGLSKIEKGNVIRIVSIEQLTKEREAIARVEEAKRKAEIDTRAKLAEAELKEAELAARKLAAEAAAEEARRRGPLREETIRLSYADPEEVAKTLQGILGIPPEGTAPVSGVIASQPGVVPSGAPPIAEPPFSSLYGPGAGAPRQVVSVSADVLAKGITIRAHKPTNTIFIRHYESDIDRIKKLIREQLDVKLPQVKIEGRMEILDRNALEAIGVQWGGAAVGGAGSTALIGQGYQSGPSSVPGQVLPLTGGLILPNGDFLAGRPTGAFGQGVSRVNQSLNLGSFLPIDRAFGMPLGTGNIVNLPIQALPNAAGVPAAAGIAFGIVGDNFNINLALQALATQGKTRTLARPEIVTVENYKATMSLGEEIPYATVSSAGTQIQFKEALLKLEVTPTVIRERINNQEVRKIKLLVVVENNSRGDVVNLGTGGSPPAINRRKAETQVLIKEGDRLVIGGVAQGVTQNTVRKVPVLGDIPVLGWLFKQRENFETGRELVVFVTPSILSTD